MHLSRQPINFRQMFNRSSLRAFILIATIITFFITPLAAQAQGPNSFAIPPYVPQESPALPDEEIVETARVRDSLPLIIDTDPGVDDAYAIAWLLSVLDDDDILGIVTVAGNTTVDNATANVYTVLSWLEDSGRDADVEVITGARKPLVKQLSSTGLLIHGKDGLWGQQMAQVAHRPRNDARDFYCDNADQEPAPTILALGPLTNLAAAIRHCPNDMQNYARIVVLGGAKFGGNTTPVAEFNFWQDPEAAQIVLDAGLNLHVVPLDAFTQLGFTPAEFGIITGSQVPVFKNLAPSLSFYAGAQVQAGAPFSIPDLVAAIYTLYGRVPTGQPQSSLVEVISRPDAVRGLSIIGLAFTEKLTMIADDDELSEIAEQAFVLTQDSEFPDLPDFNYVFAQIGAILAREPDNAQVVMRIRANAMRRLFLEQVAPTPATLDVEGAEGAAAELPENIYLPSVTSD